MGLHTSSQFRPPDGYRLRSLEQSGAELKGRNTQKISAKRGSDQREIVPPRWPALAAVHRALSALRIASAPPAVARPFDVGIISRQLKNFCHNPPLNA
jgi:hypothetical protein